MKSGNIDKQRSDAKKAIHQIIEKMGKSLEKMKKIELKNIEGAGLKARATSSAIHKNANKTEKLASRLLENAKNLYNSLKK
jgi:nucleoid DNA-binding protein